MIVQSCLPPGLGVRKGDLGRSVGSVTGGLAFGCSETLPRMHLSIVADAGRSIGGIAGAVRLSAADQCAAAPRYLRQNRMAAAHAICGRTGWPQRTLSAAEPDGRSARYLRQNRMAAAHAICGRTGWPQRTLSAAEPDGRSARYLRHVSALPQTVEVPLA